MRARERQRLEWRAKARRWVFVASALNYPKYRGRRDQALANALRIITIHGPVPLRPQAKALLGRLG